MTNDRELLELAAKAAGIEWVDGHESTGLRNANGTFWNPFTDSGQALELAVKLHICPAVDETAASAMVSLDEVSWCDLKEVSNDPYAATRRAIVRAAAEIGRSME